MSVKNAIHPVSMRFVLDRELLEAGQICVADSIKVVLVGLSSL